MTQPGARAARLPITKGAGMESDLTNAWAAVLDLLPLALKGAANDRDAILKIGQIHGSEWYRRLDAEARAERYRV